MRMNSKMVLAFAAALFCTYVFFAAPASADLMPGIRGGFYTDGIDGAFIGGEVLASVADTNWFINPNAEFVFADEGNLFTFNFDFHYDLTTHAPVYFWVGGGPAILYFDPDHKFAESQTDFGFNLLFGLGFKTGGSIVPYIQPKIILSDDTAFSIAFGVRF